MKYLKQGFGAEDLTNFYEKKLLPHVHVTWEGDFMGMCQHDIACYVCFDNPATIFKNVGIGRVDPDEVWVCQPCPSCREKGWLLQRKKPFKIDWWSIGLLSIIGTALLIAAIN